MHHSNTGPQRSPTSPPGAGILCILVLLLLAAGLSAACTRQPESETATLPSPGQTVVQTLPTAAPQLTLAPAVVLDPPAAQTAAIQVTLTAAVSPPTPSVIAPATPAPLVNEPLVNQPLPTPSGVYSWTLKVPILMYHYVSDPPPESDEYRVDLSISPDSFRQQMAYLRDNGYTAVDLYDLSLAITAQTELPDKPVVLTFDDGYIDNYQIAYPILQEYGFRGTFFIISEFVDRGREGYMTWPMIEELARAGHGVESHSRTHPNLIGKTRDQLVWEILGAQETLAAHVGYRPRYFCYPGGDYDAATIQLLRELDYWGAVTTLDGSWNGFNDRYEWARMRVHNYTTIAEFARLVDLEGTVRGKPPGS